jgi:hypothetical protein
MLASPNYYTGVYDGSGAAPGIRNTSEAITKVFSEVCEILRKFLFFSTSMDNPFLLN